METEQTVFVVDDDDSVRQSLCALVAGHGVASHAYESAEQFLESGHGRRPGCVVSDVRMPGMSGFQLYAQLRREGIDIPVILITGFAEAVEEQSDAERDGFRVLEKTCSPEELWDAIRKAMAMD